MTYKDFREIAEVIASAREQRFGDDPEMSINYIQVKLAQLFEYVYPKDFDLLQFCKIANPLRVCTQSLSPDRGYI